MKLSERTYRWSYASHRGTGSDGDGVDESHLMFLLIKIDDKGGTRRSVGKE